jgi:hypothetical protein
LFTRQEVERKLGRRWFWQLTSERTGRRLPDLTAKQARRDLLEIVASIGMAALRPIPWVSVVISAFDNAEEGLSKWKGSSKDSDAQPSGCWAWGYESALITFCSFCANCVRGDEFLPSATHHWRI